MSLESNLNWLKQHMAEHELHNARVLDIGSRNHDKTLRGWLESKGALVTGCDIEPGPEVDLVCDAARLRTAIEPGWDICTCIEALEHIADWPGAVESMKAMVRPGGLLFITTRLPGYAKHCYPGDYYRFTAGILRQAFADCTVEKVEEDWFHLGVYLRARKPAPVDWSAIHALQI